MPCRHKKISFILLSLFLFSSCLKEANEKFKVGFSQCISKDDWRKAMDQEMIIEASLYSDIDLTIFQANGDVEKQKSQLQYMINNEFDVIIISPIEPDPLVELVEKAYDKGIPIIIIDRKINSTNFTTFIGADNLEVGRNAGRFIASFIEKDQTLNVLEIRGSGNSFPKIERHKGFNEIIQKESNLNVVASYDVDMMERTSQVFDSLEINNIDFVYAFNDNIAKEAWNIAEAKGIEKKIKFIGVDGLNGKNNGIDFVEKGILEATILYPTGGNEAIKNARKILMGKPISKFIDLNTTIIDARNADIMRNQFDRINQQQKDIENQQKKIKQQEKTYTSQNNTLKLLFVLFILTLILTGYSIYSGFTLKKKKRELEIQNNKITVQRNQIKKINEEKTSFFTGLSHEFKTPITLILSTIESIREGSKKEENIFLREMALIFNNSKRLLRLINQLLDFRKIEDKKFILKASKTNIYKFSRSIFKDFEMEALKRNISFKLKTNNEHLSLFIDRNLMDKVYFNLLSNAFKFTPNNGKIEIEIIDEPESNFITIEFSDSGIGIPSEEIHNVFRPYYRGSNNNKTSSGIGLHLSKEFVELHKGTLEVESNVGTKFTVRLYKDNVHLNSDEIVFEPDLIDNLTLNPNYDYDDDAFAVQSELKDEDRDTVLIIEDNSDLSKYLYNKLKSEFNVTLNNGENSLNVIFDIIPDIIICDVNLPEKTGYEICSIIKKDIRTSHIPTIILTAYDSKDSYIQSLEAGADLYLTKPFSFGILYRSIKNQLYNRDKLRKYYISNNSREPSQKTGVLIEEDFLIQMDKHIYENIDNSKFNVEDLASKLGISRVQLYRKIKSILDLNVSNYIMNIRLEKSKSLLHESKLTISDVAYSVGFSSPSYFTSSFKNKYGITPKNFRLKNKLDV